VHFVLDDRNASFAFLDLSTACLVDVNTKLLTCSKKDGFMSLEMDITYSRR